MQYVLLESTDLILGQKDYLDIEQTGDDWVIKGG